MSIAIEKESGIINKLDWKGLSLLDTHINGLIGDGKLKTRKLNKQDDGSTGIFVMPFKKRIISVYYDISYKKVGVWDVRRDKK